MGIPEVADFNDPTKIRAFHGYFNHTNLASTSDCLSVTVVLHRKEKKQEKRSLLDTLDTSLGKTIAWIIKDKN